MTSPQFATREEFEKGLEGYFSGGQIINFYTQLYHFY